MRTKNQGPELKYEIDFKGQCSDLEGYIFDLGPIASDKFYRMMKEMERYLGITYRNRCQIAIINKTPDTFPNLEIPTIIPATGVECPKTDAYMTYLKKKNIDKATHQKLSKKDVHETDMQNICNIIVVQTN